MIALRLPKRARPDFKWPRGPVYRGRVEAILRGLNARTLSCIGDVVTRTCLQAGITPTLAAVDGATRRREEDISHVLGMASKQGMNIVRIMNPPGTLSLQAIEIVCSTLSSENPTLVLVEGEEDLLALPAIACTPPGGAVVYGAPGLGAVIVKVDTLRAREAQQRFLSLSPGLIG